jgi:hypothetical protein
MGKSLILAIDELAQGQTQAFQVVNDAVAALEEAFNRPLTIDLSDPDEDYAMAELDLVRYIHFSFISATTDRLVTLPATVNTNTTNRLVWISNDGDFDLTVQVDGGSDTVVIKSGASSAILVIGTTLRDLVGSLVGGIPHSVAYFTAGIPTTGNEVLRYSFVEAVTWAADMAGSKGSVAVVPAKQTFFFVYKNGSKVGDIMVDSTGAFTFKTDGGTAIDWAVDDILTVIYYPLEVGAITFSAKADNGDTVTIDDGTSSPVVFTFGTSGGQVNPGTTAATSATALKAAIEASALASTIRVLINGTALTIINLETAGGGSLAKSDADNDFALTAFSTETSASTFGVTFAGSRA